MKLTKSTAERDADIAKFNSKWFKKRRKVFLWLPVNMADGSIAWLQTAYLDYNIYEYNHKLESPSLRDYYYNDIS